MFRKKLAKVMGQKKNMSALEEKVDALLRFFAADTELSRDLYRQDLRWLITVQTPREAVNQKARIDRILADLGIPDHLTGYTYLLTAIEICLQNPEALRKVTAFLYPAVAQCHATTYHVVERGIRNAIECGWSRCDLQMHQRYFGGKVDPARGKPSNKEFIVRVCNVLRGQY